MNLPLQMRAVVRDPRLLTRFRQINQSGEVRPAKPPHVQNHHCQPGYTYCYDPSAPQTMYQCCNTKSEYCSFDGNYNPQCLPLP
jgi:hypothetical protein